MCMYVSLLVVVFDAARARAPTRAEPGREAPHTRGGGSAMRSVAADSSCRLPSLGKRPAEILREIGLDLDAPAVHRVGEGEPAGVQELSLQAAQLGAAVATIADQRMPDRLHVHAHLMGAPALQAHRKQGRLGQQLDHAEVRARGAPGGQADAHARAIARVAADRSVDRAGACRRVACDQREIFALQPALLERLLQASVGLLLTCHDKQPRGVAIETMHDARAALLLAAGGDAREQLRKRAFRIARTGVHDQPGGLVDHQQEGVLVADDRRKLGAELALLAVAQSADARASARSERRSARSSMSTSSSTPTVIAASARLNGGQPSGSLRKAVTEPVRTRSIRSPSAPPKISPLTSQVGPLVKERAK